MTVAKPRERCCFVCYTMRRPWRLVTFSKLSISQPLIPTTGGGCVRALESPSRPRQSTTRVRGNCHDCSYTRGRVRLIHLEQFRVIGSKEWAAKVPDWAFKGPPKKDVELFHEKVKSGKTEASNVISLPWVELDEDSGADTGSSEVESDPDTIGRIKALKAELKQLEERGQKKKKKKSKAKEGNLGTKKKRHGHDDGGREIIHPLRRRKRRRLRKRKRRERRSMRKSIESRGLSAGQLRALSPHSKRRGSPRRRKRSSAALRHLNLGIQSQRRRMTTSFEEESRQSVRPGSTPGRAIEVLLAQGFLSPSRVNLQVILRSRLFAKPLSSRRNQGRWP